MASEVELCNLALAHLGDEATVANIDPPEGSAQAEHCQRFYPIARNSLLEMHDWAFATKRTTLAMFSDEGAQWTYSYAAPSDCVRELAVIDPNATDDNDPQPFTIETDDSGNRLILTDQEDAMLRYTALVTDTTKFSALFIEALSHLLASKLAGPVIKGSEGRAEARNQLQLFSALMSRAKVLDANRSMTRVDHVPSSIEARR